MKAHLEKVMKAAKAKLGLKQAQPLGNSSMERGMQPEKPADDSPEGSPNARNLPLLQQLMKADGREIAQEAQRDGLSGTDPVTGHKAAKKHDWISTEGNPNSENDFKRNSLDAFNPYTNAKEFTSCFEPRMIAWGERGLLLGVGPGAESLKLGLDCLANCVYPPPEDCEPENWPWNLDTDERNYFEVIEYWLPEHQSGYNGDGINYLAAQEQSQFGEKMTRTALLQEKDQYDEEIIQRLEKKKAAVQAKQSIKALNRKQPRKLQGWNGFFNGDFQDISRPRNYRSRVMYKAAELKPKGDDIHKGWKPFIDCITNVFPPDKDEKDIIHMWAEYRQASWFDKLPEMTMELNDPKKDPPIPGKGGESRTVFLTKAIYGDRLTKTHFENSLEEPPFWKTKGPAAFLAGKFQKTYEDLKHVGIKGNPDPELEETVFYGNFERYPYTSTTNVLKPVMSNAAIAARKAFELYGNAAFYDKVTGAPEAKHRQVMYTVFWEKRSQEIDKMQRMYPLRDGGGGATKTGALTKGGNSGKPTECFRSQRIPNSVFDTEDQWVKDMFDPNLPDYTNEQHGEINHMMWNKHVTCTCECFGLEAGCMKVRPSDSRLPPPERKSRPDGDWRYAMFEKQLCEWDSEIPENLPSAFINRKNLMGCMLGPDSLRKRYQGLQDAYDELPG